MVFRKASGADTMAPITVPIKAMHTVSSKDTQAHLFSRKKKLQSGCRKPANIFRKVCGLVLEKIRQERVNVQTQKQGSQKQKQQSGLLFFLCALFVSRRPDTD